MFPTGELLTDKLKELLDTPSILVGNGFHMLKANYYAPDRCISASQLAKAAGYPSYSTGNQQYGAFAHRFADLLGYEPENKVSDETRWTYTLCTAHPGRSEEGHFQWILRPEIALAMENVGLVSKNDFPDAFESVANPPIDLDPLSQKARDAYIKARIGQGLYRTQIVKYWGGCSVTGIIMHEMLTASHIKPWRDCDYGEAVDLMNGLLLTPNLDRAFDKGLISFADNGDIILSKQFESDAQAFGITSNMTIRPDKLLAQHLTYLAHHRTHVFRSAG
jgi:hypothetical protein